MTPVARVRSLCVLLVPTLLFAGVYLRSLDYEFVWTDQGEIEAGLLILPRAEVWTAFGRPMLSGLEEVVPGASAPYYRPLQVLCASLIDHHLGRQPQSFRALNLVLGAATCLLVTLLALHLLGSLGAALVAGVIFALHPANLESYVWIAALSQAQATLLVTASLLLGLRAIATPVASRWPWAAAASLAALVLALGAKENAAVTPVLLAAAAVSLGSRSARAAAPPPRLPDPRTVRRRALVLGLAQAVLVALFLLVWRPRVLGGALAEAALLAGSLRVQILSAVSTWPDAMGWLLLPVESTTSDVVTLIGSPLDPRFLFGLVLAAGSLWLWIRLLRSGHEMAALGLAWIWIAFAPTSGIVPLNHMRAERYLALSVPGLSLLVAALGLALRASLTGRARQGVPALLGVGVALLLMERTLQRMPDWRSDLALFSSDVARDPLYREGHHELAKAHTEVGDLRAAKASLDRLVGTKASFHGRSSFLRVQDALGLSCHVNLALDVPRDSLDFLDLLRPDSPEMAMAPRLSLCAVRSYHTLGADDRALELLDGLQRAAPQPWRREAGRIREEIEAGRATPAPPGPPGRARDSAGGASGPPRGSRGSARP